MHLRSYAKYDTNVLEKDEAIIMDDVQITNIDLACLAPDEWLFDNVIYFSLLYQRNFVFVDYKSEIEILSPSLSQIIKMTRKTELDSIRLQLNSADILPKNIVLIPVNNANNRKMGSHWSLLILLPKERAFLHMDTLFNVNEKHAFVIAENMLNVLQEDRTGYTFDNFFEPEIIQTNGYDCGLYLLHCARESQEHFCINAGTIENFEPRLREINSINARKVILGRVKTLASK